MTPEPLGYLVAERRGGELCLGAEWTTHTTDLGEALATAERWREGGTYDAVVLALVPVDPRRPPAAELPAGNGAPSGYPSPPDAPASAQVEVGSDLDRADVARAGECPWCECGFWAEPHPCGRVARTLDVAERTVEKAREAR